MDLKVLRRLLVVNLVIIFAFVEAYQSAEETTERPFCPKICFCDEFEGLKRADCSGQNIVSTATNVPKFVEILDLSRNDIDVLTDDAFEGYKNVIDLSLARNSIANVFLDAFAEMKRLRQLDLSYNRLEGFDERIFEFNKELVGLDLSGNKFTDLLNRPLLVNPTLEVLSLRESKIAFIHPLTFSKLPKLKSIDLSENLLKSVNSSAFSKLKELEYINLEYNEWICDKHMEKFLRWCKKKNIMLQIDKCLQPKGQNSALEKIIGDATTPRREDIDIHLVWNLSSTSTPPPPSTLDLIMRHNCTALDAVETCDGLEFCKAEYSVLHSESQRLTEKLRNYEQNHNAIVVSLFYIGLFFGAILGGVLTYILCFVKNSPPCLPAAIDREAYRRDLRKTVTERSRLAQPHPGDSPILLQRMRSNGAGGSGGGGGAMGSGVGSQRVPSFRNSLETRQEPRTPRRTPSNTSGRDDLPPFMRLFRRAPKVPAHASVIANSASTATAEPRHPLPNPDGYYVTMTSEIPLRETSSPHERDTNLESPISNAFSTSSVVYQEVDEESFHPRVIPAAEVVHVPISLAEEEEEREDSPPPPYIDCLETPSSPKTSDVENSRLIVNKN